MGVVCLYEVLGVVWLSDNEEYHAKLVKEALKRGSSEEKQRYLQIQQQKEAIFRRLQELAAAQIALNLRDAQNVLPLKPSSRPMLNNTSKTQGLPHPSLTRSKREEADFDAKLQQYTAALKVYQTQDSTVFSERLKLMADYLALQSEYAALEEDEKWLLLAMAIKNQSSLMGYMSGDDKK
jgi:hypothetical protein